MALFEMNCSRTLQNQVLIRKRQCIKTHNGLYKHRGSYQSFWFPFSSWSPKHCICRYLTRATGFKFIQNRFNSFVWLTVHVFKETCANHKDNVWKKTNPENGINNKGVKRPNKKGNKKAVHKKKWPQTSLMPRWCKGIEVHTIVKTWRNWILLFCQKNIKKAWKIEALGITGE